MRSPVQMEREVQAVLEEAGVKTCHACSADRIVSRRIRARHGIRHLWWWRLVLTGDWARP